MGRLAKAGNQKSSSPGACGIALGGAAFDVQSEETE